MYPMEPNVYRGEYTPLHQAVLERRAARVAALLAEGAHPNSEVLGEGFTALDLAVSRGALELIPLLVRAGGKPGVNAWRYRSDPGLAAAVALLDGELERHRAVEVAEELALTPWRIQEARRLLEEGAVEEAQSVLEPVRGWRRDTDESLHMRIRSLIAQGQSGQAMEEAAAVFALYREQGFYRQALQVSREMRRIDPSSARPYELELRFLVDLGCRPEAERCQQELLRLHLGDPVEQEACRKRFDLLLRSERTIPLPRPPLEMEPLAWEGPAWFEPAGNLPAPAAPSMEEWEQRFLGGRQGWEGLEGRSGVTFGEQAWARFAELAGDRLLHVWEEYAPVTERRRPARPDLAPGTFVFPEDQSWSLALLRSGRVVLIEL